MNDKLINFSILFLLGIFLCFTIFSTKVSAGTFVYDKTPAFTVTFPDEFIESEDKGTSVYKARGNTASLSISISDLKEGAKLENAAKYYAKSLSKVAKGGSELQILSAVKKCDHLRGYLYLAALNSILALPLFAAQLALNKHASPLFQILRAAFGLFVKGCHVNKKHGFFSPVLFIDLGVEFPEDWH